MEICKTSCLLCLLASGVGVGCGPRTDGIPRNCKPLTEVDLCEEARALTPTVELGTGETSFEAFEDMAILTPVWGPQGGQHIWASFRATGLNPGVECSEPGTNDPVRVTLSANINDGAFGPYEFETESYLEGDSESSQTQGITSIICVYDIAWAYPDLYEIPTDWQLTVTDSCGTTVSDTRDFLLDLSEYNREE